MFYSIIDMTHQARASNLQAYLANILGGVEYELNSFTVARTDYH